MLELGIDSHGFPSAEVTFVLGGGGGSVLIVLLDVYTSDIVIVREARRRQ